MKYTLGATLLTIVLAMFLISCEREISVDLPIPEDKLVVEGYIEEGGTARVSITKNAPFFGTVDSATVAEMFVQDAFVTVSDGVLIDTLLFTFNFNNFPFFEYVGTKILGEQGKSYTLKIEHDNKEYSSETQIPASVPIDSLVFQTEPGYDSLGYVWLHYTDPDTIGNFYRMFTKTLNLDNDFVHPFASVIDDKLINGQPVEYPLYRGLTAVERANLDNNDGNGNDGEEVDFREYFMFKKGQTVVIKLATIDAFHYEFWSTIEQQLSSNGNPFASPTTPRTNIEGGALGVWGGYGVSIDTVYIDVP